MQIFGKFTTNFDMDFINGHYIYFNENDEDIITSADVEQMLKKKRKTVCGTIILYNPELSPVGYTLSPFLHEEGFEKYDEFVEKVLGHKNHYSFVGGNLNQEYQLTKTPSDEFKFIMQIETECNGGDTVYIFQNKDDNTQYKIETAR